MIFDFLKSHLPMLSSAKYGPNVIIAVKNNTRNRNPGCEGWQHSSDIGVNSACADVNTCCSPPAKLSMDRPPLPRHMPFMTILTNIVGYDGHCQHINISISQSNEVGECVKKIGSGNKPCSLIEASNSSTFQKVSLFPLFVCSF
jgi:hypothetical protein